MLQKNNILLKILKAPNILRDCNIREAFGMNVYYYDRGLSSIVTEVSRLLRLLRVVCCSIV